MREFEQDEKKPEQQNLSSFFQLRRQQHYITQRLIDISNLSDVSKNSAGHLESLPLLSHITQDIFRSVFNVR